MMIGSFKSYLLLSTLLCGSYLHVGGNQVVEIREKPSSLSVSTDDRKSAVIAASPSTYLEKDSIDKTIHPPRKSNLHATGEYYASALNLRPTGDDQSAEINRVLASLPSGATFVFDTGPEF